MLNKVISVAGQANNGKDEVGRILREALIKHTGEDWHIVRFSYEVKRIFCSVFGVDEEFIEKWKRVDEIPDGFDCTVRQGLIKIGDGFRQIQHDIWIDLLAKNNDGNVIIVDSRYINELKFVKSRGGFSVLVWRPGHENGIPNESEQQLMPFVEELKKHPDGLVDKSLPVIEWRNAAGSYLGGTNRYGYSEVDIRNMPVDYWVRNDGDVTNLEYKVGGQMLSAVLKHFNG